MLKKILSVSVLLGSFFVQHAQDQDAKTQENPSQKHHAAALGLDQADIMYIDMQAAMLGCKQGVDAQDKVEAEEKKYAELAQKEQQKMMQMKSDIETKASMMTADARRKKEKELADMQRDFQNKVQDWNYELKYTMQRETDAMLKEIEKAAVTLAKQENKAAVIDVQTGRVLYLRDDLNETNKLVALLDKEYAVALAQKEAHQKAEVQA